MSTQGRRSSILNIEDWLDKCPNDEPDSIIYDPDYCSETAANKTKQISVKLESLIKGIIDICTKIGLSPVIIEDRLIDTEDCLTIHFNTILKDVLGEYDKLHLYQENLLNQTQKMLKDLNLPPYELDGSITLLQKCKCLKTKFNELDVVKQKRMTRLQELRENQTKHCIVLGIKAPLIKTQTDIPSEEELIQLSNAVLNLQKEEKRKREKYNLLKDQIMSCMIKTEYEPETEFEKSILSSPPDFTHSHLQKMSDLHSKLEKTLLDNQEKFETLKARLISLYDRLDVVQQERSNFLDSHTECKPSVMEEMELEVEQYEELKRKNIGKFIEKIKVELEVEYERCYVHNDQQEQIFALSTASGECNEELLDLYEKELERVKKYYKDNMVILEKFHKWKSMLEETIQMDQKAYDPNRFTNRGGQLLLEEKKRKALQRGLPKVEKELLALNQKYSDENQGNKFLVFGTNLEEFIKGCWDELQECKEVEKRQRQFAQLSEKGGKKATPAQNIVTRTPTKRPIGAGPTPTPSKYHKSAAGTPSNATYRSHQTTMINSAAKSAQKNVFQPRNHLPAKGTKHSNSGAKSNIPVALPGSQVSLRDKQTVSSSNGSDLSALSVNEKEFEDMIVLRPTSAKRTRR